MNTKTDLDLTSDIIAVTDIIERFEELESMEDGLPNALERCALAAILDDLRSNGGDEQWRGDWYPGFLIRDSHFKDYAIEMLEDCGTIPKDLPSWVEIDWERTARNVRIDYTGTTIEGVTYWYR
jgi:hypothetical protein